MKLEVRNLTKSFEDNQVLHGVSFEVESGSALGLLGRNGHKNYYGCFQSGFGRGIS